MLEIKSYDDWITNQKDLAEPTTNLKKYADYVRSSYYNAGQLNKDTEQEIRNGVEDRLRSDGLITEDMPEEDQNNLFSSVVGSSRNTDTDARFVLDHFRTESEDGVDVNDVRASTLANYLTMRERSPSEADGFKPYVDEILADKSLVKRARMSAVDRGEYSIAALDEEDGKRTLYAGPNAQPDAIGGEISSLLATGAISSSDLYKVNDFVKSTNGGLSNGAKDSRFEAFSRSVADLAKTDKDFDKVIGSAATALKEEKTAELRTTGEAILEGAKTVVTYPFIKGAELIADVFDGDEVQPKYAPDTKLSDVLASNPAFNKRFSAAEIEEYSDALTNKVAGAPYRADRPESGITTDSMGNLNIAPQLLYNTAQFEKAVALAPLNKDQQKQASVQRKLLAETGAPDMLRMVLEESPEAVGKYAKAKADGLSASEFLEQYVADTKNYDAFDTRLEQFGKGAWKTLAEFPLGIAALAGNEWAAKEMGDMMKDQTRRQEFSRLHGDEYGFGFQLLNVLPQVAVDIGLTIGTGGAFAGAKALAKTGAMSARSMIRSGAKMALSEVDDVAATSFRQAAEAGGEQYLGTALKEIGRSVGEKFGELAPLAAVTLTRSAGSAFGSIYNQLPDDMSHEEKYKTALPTALAMGVSTAVITVGLSGLGFAGTEAVATRAIRRLRGGETDAAVASGALEAAERAVPVGKMNYRQSKQAFEDVYNEGQILNDAAFNTAARAAITGTYKNWLKTTLKGGLSEKFEEALDTAVGTALEDAALDRDTPLSEKVAQVFNAGLIGGSLGAGIAGATQFGPIRKSEQSLVFEGRASAFEEIANRLRSVDSNATADVLQRRIEDERAKAKMSVEGDVAIQSALDKFQERTEAANRTEKPIDKSVFEQAFFSKPLQAPVWDAENNKWITPTEEQKPNEPLLVDLVGQRVSYGDFDGVLEEGPNKSVHLRLDKPYGKKGGQMVEIIDLGPRFQKASNLVTQEPTFLTTGEPIFDVPAGTPYVTQGRYKEKFAFPPKDKVTPESFKMEPDDEGNVRSIMIDGGQSLKSASVRMPIIITGDSRIQAVAKWYGLDIEPKLEITETPEGQFEFGFTNTKGTIKSKEEFGFGEGGGEPYLTDEELQAQTDDTLGRSFAPAMEGEIELQSPSVQQIRVKKVLQQFDTQISSKQESLKKVIAAIESFVEPFKDIADKNLTDDQRFIKKQNIEREEQSTDLKKKLTKELSALKKAKKNYSEDTIQLGGTPTPTPSMEEMDRDWVSSLDQIKTNYSTTVDGPLDVNQLEDTILATRLSNKMGVRLSFSDVTDSQLDAIEQMANDVISYANDPENTASETTRKTTQGKYANLLGRVQIIQQYRAEFAAPSESEYKQIYKELRDAGFEVTLPEVQPEVASDLDTLHYLLSTKPQKVSPTKVTKSVASIDEKTGQPTSRRTEERDVGTVTIFPFANPTFIQQAKAQGVEINEARLTETQVVQIEGYDQDTREILYKGEGGITMRAPLSIVDLSPPTLREFIDAESKGVFDATQQAKRDAAAFKRRTSKPIQDRAIEFLTSVSNYVKKITELDARLEAATGRRPSSFVKNLKNQISEVKKQASAFINQKGGVLVDDIQFYQSLDDNGRQEIIDSVRTAIYGQGGYKSVAPRAKVYVLRPEAKIPTTKVELPKGEFRKGTQEEQLVRELIEGGFKVDLQGLGQRLALSRMFETESGMMKYPAFSGSIVENVQQAGQEVAETNSYIKNSNEFLEEEILKRYPQLGEFGYSSKAAKIKGKVSSVGDGDAMLASIQVELTNLDSRIATAQMTGAPVPDSILEKRAVLAEQLKKYKTLLSEERYYKIGKKEYETRLSQQYTGVHYPIDEEVVQGATITFGVFTNNFEITRAQIAAGLRIRIPDSFDRDLFNPSQHKSIDGDMIDGYYLPYEQEPYMVGTTYRTSNPNIDENGEQVLDLRVTQNVLRKRLLVDRMVNPELMKVRVRDASGEERFRSSRFRDFYVAAMDAIVKRSRIVLESMAKNRNPRYPWTYIGMDNTISELSIGYTADLNEYRLAQHIVKKAMGSLNWKNLTNESMGRETLARFLEEEGGMKFEYEEVQDPDYVEGESRIKTGPRRRVVSSVTPSIEFGDLPDSIRRQIITEEGNITDKIKATNLSKFVVEMMDGDVDSIANDIKAAYKDIRGTDPHSVISEYARRLFVNATVVGGRFYSLPNYAGSDMIKKLKGVANKYAKAEQDAISRISLDALPDLDGFDVESVVGAAGNDLFQAVLDHITSTRQKLGAAGVSDLFESAGELTGALTSSELAFVDRGAFLADELYNTVQSDKAVGQAFRDIAEWVGLKKNELDNLSDTAVVSALAGKLNTDYVFHTNKGAARIALAQLSQTEAGKRAAGLLILRGWLPPVMVDGRQTPLQTPSEREAATPAPTKEILDYSRQYLDAVQSLLPSINEASRIKSLELRGIEEARADIYDSYRLIRALVGATTPEEGGMVHTKTQKEIAEGIELGAPFVTSGEVNKFLSKEVAAIQAELTTLRDKRNKVEQLFEQDAPRMLERLNLILNGSPDFTRDENGKPVPVKGGGKPSLLETVKDKKKRRALLAEVRQLQEKSTAILTFGRETMDSLDASISVKEGQLQKAEARKNVATPVLLDSLFANIARANQQIDMQRGFISRLSTTVRDRIKEEQASVERLRNLEPYKRYVELVTGLPVVAERSAERSAAMERFLDLSERSAADRKRIQDYADKRREELAKALVNSGVGLNNSGLLSTYVDPVDVSPTPAPTGAPVTLTFDEGNFSEAERAASTTESFAAATEELTTTAQEKARAKLEGVDVPAREVGGRARVLSKPRAYDPNRLRTGDTPPELPEMEQFEGVDVPTREVGGRLKPLSKPRAYDPNDQFQSLSTLDPALRDEARAENIAEVQRLGLESGNPNSVVEALKVIAKTGSPRQRLVAELLSTAPDFIRNIRFAIVELDLGFAGLFDRDSNTVVVNLNEHNGRGLVDVLLHEYLHAPTVNVLLDPKTTAQRKAVARIEAIRNFAAANAARLGIDTEPAVRLGLQSNVEFLTYAFTAPDFQNILAGLTLPQQRSILRRIVDAVLSIFGLDPKKHMVAADAIQELFDFTKMSLAHSGTFSLDGKMRALSRSSRRDNERALAYSNLTSAELINNVISRYTEGDLDTIFEARANAIPLTEKEHSRHAELESRKDNLTSEEIAEAKALVTKAAIKSSFNLGPLYHATWSEFKDPNKFDPSKGQLGTHFGSINQARDVYAMGRETGEKPRMYPSFIKALKPIRLEDTSEDWTLVHTQPAVSELLTEQEIKTIRSSTVNNNTKYDIVRNAIERNGYDSIVYLNRTEGIYNPSISYEEQRSPMSDKVFRSKFKDAEDSYIVFRPEQIKSAEPFTGVPLQERFNVSEQDIRYIQAGRAGVSPIDVLEEIKRVVPEGIDLVVDEELEGAMGARRSVPNTIFVNPSKVNGIAYKLSRSDAKAAVRTAVDEELAHLASYRAYTEEDFVQLANEMGDAMVNRVAHRVFEHSIPDYTERQAFITSELESGNLRPSDIAAEWVRSQITIASVGRGREEHYKFLSTNPSLMNKFLEALRSFITELKQRLSDVFTTGTASKMSRASREFRRLRNGGVTPLVDAITGKFFGDSTDLLNALDGNLIEGQEDRVRYIYPFASTNPTKVDKIWDKIVRKMYDLPLELKALVNQRDGAVNEIQATMRDFGKRWPKLRDTALAAGVSIEDIGMLLGTTAPAVQGKARKELEREVSKFIEDNADSENLKALAAKFESERAKPIADNFFAQFRKDQKAMEDKLRAAGFSTLVNYLVDFRQQVNKYKGMINFDESNDVYLTRTYKFFTTEGWASAALKGGTIEIDGETVDFNKLRVVAAKHFVKEVEIDAKAEGITLTEDQKDQRTLEKLDAYLEDIQKRAQESKDLGVMNTVKRDINRLLQKKDFGEPLRALLGEVKDPFENAVRTAYSVGRLAANDRFLREFAAQAIDLKLANREGGKDMELLFSPKVDAEMGDLAGLYVHKDIAAAIRQELGPKGRDHETASMKRINGIGRLLSKISGFATTTQTLGSVGFYPRNILGGMALLAANGIVNPVNARTAIGLSVAANLRSADSKETLDTIRRLTELQVINDETRGRIAMDMFRGFTATTDEQLEELMTDMVEAQVTGKVDKLMKRLKVKEGFMKTVDVLAAVNDTIDSAMKINAYLYELDVLTKAYGNTEDVSKLEAMAARKVKLYMPTHSDQVSLIKAFNRSPFAMIALPFARWKSEVLRTMLNIVPLAMEEINSGNAVMRGRGVKRLIGFSSTILGGGTAFGLVFGTLFSLLTGDDEEDELGRTLTDEELEAVKEGLPEYQRNHGLFARKIGKDGVQVIDLTNILPYSMTTDLVKLGAAGNVKGMAEYMAKEVVGAQIAANTLIEVFNNKDGFGNAIALQSDNAPIAAGKLTLHLMKGTVIPSAFKKGTDMLRYGQQNALELAAGELTGARPVIHKAADLEYRGLTKIKTSMDEAVTLLYPLSSGKAFDPTKVEGLIDKHQAASNVTQKRLYDFITSMKNLGSTDEDIFATSNKIGISKQRLGNAMQGLNSPWIPNDAWFKKMYANKTRAREQDPEEIATELIRILPKKADEYSTSIY
jgi:hypothetical protein